MVSENKYTFFYWLLFGLAIYSIFVNNWQIGYWDQDESAYAGFAFTFLETNNWLIPDFIWSEVHRKPPLHFWNIALAFQFFGVNEFATRIPSACAIIGTLLLIKIMGKPLFGKQVADRAMIIAASSILLIALAKISVTDGTLLFFETLAVFSLFNYLKSRNYLYLLAFIVGIAGGTLTKGPPVLIVSYGILGILFLFKAYRWQTIILFLTSLLGLLPLYFWGRAAWNVDNGEFIMWMLDWYILQRGKGVFGQTGPPGYFLGIFLFGTFAFSAYFILGLKQQIGSFFKKAQRNEQNIFLIAWLCSGWLVYELIMSKLPAYAIGAFPTIAIIIAQQVAIEHSTKWSKFANGAQLFLTIALGGGFVYLGIDALTGIAGLMAIAMGVIVIVMGLFIFIKKVNNFLLSCALMILPSIVTWSWVVPSIEAKKSTTKLVANHIIENYSNKNTVLFCSGFALPSLPMYLATANYDYHENHDLSTWIEAYNNHEILILNEEKFQLFSENMNQNFNGHSIDGWIPDRGKKITYYIISK